ncbi:MAG: discoidin domain-containing protein, partial [Verrucomicrobiales bacterium]
RVGIENGQPLIETARAAHTDNEALAKIIDIGRSRMEDAKRRQQQTKFLAQGELHYQTICIACHGPNGKGTPAPGLESVTLGAPLAKSPRVLGKKDLPIKILLKGLHGELDGKSYPGPMLPLESYDDEWLASVLTYVRRSWGNKASSVTPEEIALVRAAVADRKEMYQSSEILAMTSIPSNEMKTWSITASHNAKGCQAAIDDNPNTRWDTGGEQRAGMWFAFDMKQPRQLSSLTLRCERSSDDYPREYAVETSLDGKEWKEVVPRRSGQGVVTDILLPSAEVRHVRINQHGRSNGKHWSIHQLEVFAK